MNKRPYFSFSKSQRNGVFFLLCIMVGLQVFYHFGDTFFGTHKHDIDAYQDPEVVSFLKQLDSLEADLHRREAPVIHPFNPNFISDYKAYLLGMSPEQADRLFRYRESGRFLNSAEQFQAVTGIDDSLLAIISPMFKFPDFKRNPVQKGKVAARVKGDLNLATAEELQQVYGVGEVLSSRIVSYRAKLGGYSLEDQLSEVYGLSPEVVVLIREYFEVKQPPDLVVWDVNTAGVQELASVPYIGQAMASRIVAYRSLRGEIDTLEELTKIQGFPSEKIDRIKLYLRVNK